MPTKAPKSEPLWPFLFTVALVVAVTTSYAVTLLALLPDSGTRAEFGDMFGALNTAFSGLAFAALAYTLNLQRKELALQRQELTRQADAQTDQAETALRAAEINALGSLFQSYSQLLAAEKAIFISKSDWQGEIQRVRDRLNKLLEEESFRGSSASR